jgi:RimJ/RimL family protein N-acetyltransferase
MERRILTTERLELIAGDLELLEAEMLGPQALERRLEARVAPNWPPEYFDAPAIEFAAAYLRENPGSSGWMLWYLIWPRAGEGARPEGVQGSAGDMVSTAGSTPSVVGIAGFKGKPSGDGTVEVGYSVLNQFQRRGIATEAVATLLDWAFVHRAVERVIAETYPHLHHSIRVLEKNGFRPIGPGSGPGIVRYELPRAERAAARLKALHDRKAHEAPHGSHDPTAQHGSADSDSATTAEDR